MAGIRGLCKAAQKKEAGLSTLRKHNGILEDWLAVL